MPSYKNLICVAALTVSMIATGCVDNPETPVAPDVYNFIIDQLAGMDYTYNRSRVAYQPGDLGFILENDANQVVEPLCDRTNSIGLIDPMNTAPGESLDWDFATPTEKVVDFFLPDPAMAAKVSAKIESKGYSRVHFFINSAQHLWIDEATYGAGQRQRSSDCINKIRERKMVNGTIYHLLRVLKANVMVTVQFNNNSGFELSDVMPLGRDFGGKVSKDPAHNTLTIGPSNLTWGIRPIPEN